MMSSLSASESTTKHDNNIDDNGENGTVVSPIKKKQFVADSNGVSLSTKNNIDNGIKCRLAKRLASRVSPEPKEGFPPRLQQQPPFCFFRHDLDDGGTKFGRDGSVESLKRLLEDHAFRTSLIQSPRPGVSVYREVKEQQRLQLEQWSLFPDDEMNKLRQEGREFLSLMLGVHPRQEELERWYATSIRMPYCVLLYCQRLRFALSDLIVSNERFRQLVTTSESDCETSLVNTQSSASLSCDYWNQRVAKLTEVAIEMDDEGGSVAHPRREQMQREWDHIQWSNTTLANAHVCIFQHPYPPGASQSVGKKIDETSNLHWWRGCSIRDIFYKRVSDATAKDYERMAIYLYDPQLDHDLALPPTFHFVPSLPLCLAEGPRAVAEQMVTTFWTHLLRQGYYAATSLRAALSPSLQSYFVSGLLATKGSFPSSSSAAATTFSLGAHFTPDWPLSWYLHGKAGAGKSSLVRHVPEALAAALEAHVDPEMAVQGVKQNLNKPHESLQLELQLRPNNNDLSVMSIIQGRRQRLGQSKPGLVVLHMEEMPAHHHCSDEEQDGLPNDPNQLQTARLISQRFAGRKGTFRNQNTSSSGAGPRRGISGDASILVLVTSNYHLAPPSGEALQRLDMFRNLIQVPVEALAGEDRNTFAHAYLRQCLKDSSRKCSLTRNMDMGLQLYVPLGEGDSRPLVRHLRMLAFYLTAFLAEGAPFRNQGNVSKKRDARVLKDDNKIHIVRIEQKKDDCKLSIICINSQQNTSMMPLKIYGSMRNLYPVKSRSFDPITTKIMERIKNHQREAAPEGWAMEDTELAQLSIMIDFWLSRTLCPTVIVSRDRRKIASIMESLSNLTKIHTIHQIDANAYKMQRSLYDPKSTPNLRDDILMLVRAHSSVAIELLCSTDDAQLCVREMIEDTPSMTAYSTVNSALHKDGLLFLCYVEGETTPEILSRSSLVL